MRQLTSPFRRRRRNGPARTIEYVAVRVLGALWLARLAVRHGLRHGR